MNGPEMMIARLIGVKPEEMRAQIQQALELMKSGAQAAAKVQNDLELIKKHLGITENEEVVINERAIPTECGNSANGNRIQL